MPEEKTLLNGSLVFLIKENYVLFAIKAKKIGIGCWNGYGGGIEDGESPRESAVRKLEEESGASASQKDLEKVAIVDFHNTKTDGSIFVCRVHVFFAYSWTGTPQETPEMHNLTWFHIQALPLDNMMLADREWLPLVLNGKKIKATFHYGPFQKELLQPAAIQEVKGFEDVT